MTILHKKFICVTACYPLKGLIPDAVYSITDIDTQETVEIAGKTLISEGLTVTISEKYQSKILLYRIKQ